MPSPLLIFIYLLEMRFHHVGQAGLKLLTSSEPLLSASQSAGITSLSHHAQPYSNILEKQSFSVTQAQCNLRPLWVQAILLPQPPE